MGIFRLVTREAHDRDRARIGARRGEVGFCDYRGLTSEGKGPTPKG